MNWTQVSLQATQPQPWRNGGGTTRELLAWPRGEDWQVRISVADVRAAGPFSRFAGIERWFAVLEGDGVVLRSPDAEVRLTQDSDPFRFDGELPIDCELVRGPTVDFNLMALPGRALLRRVRGTVEVRSPAGALVAVHAHGSSARLQWAAGTLILPPDHMAWTVAPEAFHATLQAEDALWMEVLT